MLAVQAEFERELISERTRAGMAAARRKGKHIGRPRKLTTQQVFTASGSHDGRVTRRRM